MKPFTVFGLPYFQQLSMLRFHGVIGVQTETRLLNDAELQHRYFQNCLCNSIKERRLLTIYVPVVGFPVNTIIMFLLPSY
jgi:hypothetical protein